MPGTAFRAKIRSFVGEVNMVTILDAHYTKFNAVSAYV
jgi:hypothetical protein